MMQMGEATVSNFDPFADRAPFVSGDVSHEVFCAGDGAPVILIHELPGMTPQFWRFAHWLVDAGFTVYAPDLYSRNGEPAGRLGLGGALIRTCISREIHLLARNHSSPVTVWLRALARHASNAQSGAKVGVVGMCMTGNFALSLVLEDVVAAPVASQPSLPFGFGKGAKSALHMSREERDALKRRTDVPVVALRFDGDPACTKYRFDALHNLIGDRLEAHVLPDSAKNPKGNPFPHAVLTADLIDEDGQPTKRAAERVIAFLSERLKASG